MLIRKKRVSLPVAALVLVLTCAANAAEPGNSSAALFGFNAANSQQQLNREQAFDSYIDAREMEGWLKELSSRVGIVGSPGSLANANFVLDKFKSFGWDAKIETFHVLYPKPRRVQVQLLGPQRHDAVLNEGPIAGDASSANREGVIPPYLSYGGDGDVSGDLVYVNYGLPDDYKELARRRIDVRGKIVIARYGGGWRGLKPLLAQQKGAIGALIYSDPRDDGYYQGDVYPAGGWRPEQSVQRGSVADMMLYPGDPLTPGYGSVEGAKRLPIEEARTILKIPVLPLSYGDATPLLKALQGPVAPESWRGALPLTYKMGPGPAQVRIVVESDWEQVPVYNVNARLQGAELPEQWVLRGNHRDTWVMGAQDPLSGTVAMLAEAKAFGRLFEQGWRPRRTLVYNSWDGEEAGLLGSTEWVETHADELRDKAIVYINSDSNGRGFLGAGGSHSLQHLINQVSASVTDPQTGVSVQERLRARMRVAGDEGGAAAKAQAAVAAKGGDLPIGALGSGSDYASFLHFLGVASINVGFGGESESRGVYHSHYDTYEHFSRFGDPGLAYSAALAKVSGRLAMRTSEADVVPMRFTDMGSVIATYVTELQQLVGSLRAATASQHTLLDSNALTLAGDPTRPLLPPERESVVPAIDLAPLQQASARLSKSLQRYERAYARNAAANLQMSASKQQQINALILRMEQSLTDPAGLPGRSWYRHFIYAPGVLTGYGVKTLPGVREALEARRWEEANTYAKTTAEVIDRYRTQIDSLTALLQKS